MAESQVKKTRIEILRVEAALAKLDAPKAADPAAGGDGGSHSQAGTGRRPNTEGVGEEIVPQSELLDAEANLGKLQLELAELTDPLAASAPKAPDPRRAAMEAVVRTLETIVEKTRDGVRRSIIPEAELLNAEATLALYKFKLVELTHAPAADARKPRPRSRPHGKS